MITFLIGIALSIPLSIIANLFTPKVHKRLMRRSTVKVAKRYEAIVEEYAIVSEMHEDPAKLHFYFMDKTLFFVGATSVCAVGGIAVLFPVSGIIGSPNNAAIWADGLYLPFLVFMVSFLFWLASLWFKARRILHNVEDFEEYAQKVDERLAKLGKRLPAALAEPRENDLIGAPPRGPS